MVKGLKNILKGQSGFTLLEAALTTVILSVAMWASLTMISSVNAHSYTSDLKAVASQLANEKIETIIADKAFAGYDEIASTNAEQLDGTFEGFTRIVTVTEVSAEDLSTPTTGSGIKLITVNVSWGDDEDDAISVQTIVGETSES